MVIADLISGWRRSDTDLGTGTVRNSPSFTIGESMSLEGLFSIPLKLLHLICGCARSIGFGLRRLLK
jgi:hypothetical protein